MSPSKAAHTQIYANFFRNAQRFLSAVLNRRLKPIRLEPIVKEREYPANKYDICNVAKMFAR